MDSTRISHEGVVEGTRDRRIRVRFTRHSACSDCHAKGICSVSDQENKSLEFNDSAGKFKTGEKVQIILSRSLGFRAMFIAYILPFLIVLLSLILFTSLSISEGMAGLLSLGILVPYYLTLKIFRKKIDKTYTFTLRQIPQNRII